MPAAELPAAESLQDTLARVLPFWHGRIAPELRRGRNVLVAAHGNSLRAMVKMLDNVSESEIVELNIPTGVPLLYELDAQLKPLQSRYLGDPAAIAAAAEAVRRQTESADRLDRPPVVPAVELRGDLRHQLAEVRHVGDEQTHLLGRMQAERQTVLALRLAEQLRLHWLDIHAEAVRLQACAHRATGGLVGQGQEECDRVHVEGSKAARAQALDHLLVPGLLMRGTQFADDEVEAHHEEGADYGESDDQPEVMNDRLPRYSSGAMVTRSPESSGVNSI